MLASEISKYLNQPLNLDSNSDKYYKTKVSPPFSIIPGDRDTAIYDPISKLYIFECNINFYYDEHYFFNLHLWHAEKIN